MDPSLSAGMGRRTTADLVADHLRSEIVCGRMEPGAIINVAAITNDLGVSQTPAREALQVLAHEGLIELHAFRKALVAPMSADEYEEIFIMRVGLEGLAAELGAERISDQEIRELQAKLRELAAVSKEDDIDQFIEIDRDFHRIHYLAARRERLWDRIINLRTTAERYTRLGYRLPEVGPAVTVESHRRLFDAVKAHDGPRARNEIVTDLTHTYDTVRATLISQS